MIHLYYSLKEKSLFNKEKNVNGILNSLYNTMIALTIMNFANKLKKKPYKILFKIEENC